MEDKIAGVMPAADSASTATPKPDAPPAGAKPQPRTAADIIQSAAASLLKKETPPQPPTPVPTQESSEGTEPEATSTEVLSQPESDEGQTPKHDEDDAGDAWPKSAVERVRKLREQKRKLKEELEALKRRDDDDSPRPEPQAKPATNGNRIETLHDPAEIEQTARTAEETADAAEALLDDLIDDPANVERQLRRAGVKLGETEEDWSPKAMREFLRGVQRNARATMKAAPARLQYLRTQADSFTEAVTVLPTLKDSSSDEFKLVNQMVSDFPDIKRRPDWPMQCAIYALGFQAYRQRSAKAESKQAPAPRIVARPAPTAGTPRSAPSQVPPSEIDSASQRLREKRDGQSMLDYARAAARAAIG